MFFTDGNQTKVTAVRRKGQTSFMTKKQWSRTNILMNNVEETRRMRLVILTQYYPPEMGAPQSRLYELAAGFRDLNWDVSVITAMPNYPTGKIFEPYLGKISTDDFHEGVPVKRYWLYPSNSSNTLPRLISMLSFSATAFLGLPFLYKQKPDYIFVESPPLTLAFSAWLMAKITGSKLIMNVSDLWPLSAKELGAIGEGFLYHRIEDLEKFLYENAFVCTGQSQEIVDYISKKEARRVFLFRNGVDIKRFKVEMSSRVGDRRRLVYAGLLGVAQGILSICQNVKFKDLGVEFHIYGSGAEKEEIEKFLAQNQNSNIFLHPPVGRREIPGILSEYDGTLIPLAKKIYGAVPSKIYEAMAAGLPIIFSGDGEAAQIIQEHQVGWVSATNHFQQLERNIAEFVNDAEKRTLYSLNGVKCASEIFDRERQIKNLHVFLQSHINN